MDQKKRILVLAPHTDDGELGCGASIAQFAESGKEIFYVAFSICSRSLPSHLAPDTLKIEAKNATKALGIKPENVFFKDYDVRRFKEFRQDILEDLVKLRAELKPDLVFLPASQDIHQDHQVIAEEGFRAFKNTSVLGYELPWNTTSFNSQGIVKITEQNLATKINALKEYKSQEHRNYFNEDFIRGLAVVRGVQASAPLAEAFEILRWII